MRVKLVSVELALVGFVEDVPLHADVVVINDTRGYAADVYVDTEARDPRNGDVRIFAKRLSKWISLDEVLP